jgi:hypothetical protein
MTNREHLARLGANVGLVVWRDKTYVAAASLV